MEQLSLPSYLTIFSAVFCIVCGVLIVLEKKKNKVLSQQLMKTTIKLEVTRKKFANLQGIDGNRGAFQDSLRVAELTTKLQKTRLEAQKIDTGAPPPGKYSSIPSLAEKGMSAEEIASLLTISTQEALQLVNLARLAQAHGADTVAG